MAASQAGALKALIESLGLSISAYRDTVPEGTTLPYVRIQEAITVTVQRHGDFGDTTASEAVTEDVQVDLWQQARHPTTNAVTESYTLPDALIAGLHGAVLSSAPKHVYGVRVLGCTRFYEVADNQIRHVITVALDRAL